MRTLSCVECGDELSSRFADSHVTGDSHVRSRVSRASPL